MKMISPDSIAPETRSWFGNQIQNLAIRHDLAGPAISRVPRGKYIKDLVKEFRARAVAAIKARELVLSSEQMDVFCREAAKELIEEGLRRFKRILHKDAARGKVLLSLFKVLGDHDGKTCIDMVKRLVHAVGLRYLGRVWGYWLFVTEYDDTKWLMYRNHVRFVFVFFEETACP